MATLAIVLVLAIGFAFLNGFHDAANSVATIVSTRAMSPRSAVMWAAFFNFVAFLVFDTRLAAGVARGVDPRVVSLDLIVASLVGAIGWGLATWWRGLPTSSSHALLGGLAGAAIVKAGFGALDARFFGLTLLFLLLSPLLGGLAGFVSMALVEALFGHRSPRKIDRAFRGAQLLSASLYSLGHGGNDAQKTVGLVVAALVATGHLAPATGGVAQHVPFWVVLTCHAALGLGTLSGGWRIVRTLGMTITRLPPAGGFCAEASGALTLLFETFFAIPVSATQTIAGAIVGAGSTRKVSAVRWGIAGRIVWAWLLTLPGAAAIGAVTYLLLVAAGGRR